MHWRVDVQDAPMIRDSPGQTNRDAGWGRSRFGVPQDENAGGSHGQCSGGSSTPECGNRRRCRKGARDDRPNALAPAVGLIFLGRACALAITPRAGRLSYPGPVPKTFPPMTRDLEHPYLSGGAGRLFFVYALLPCQCSPNRFSSTGNPKGGTLMVGRDTTWQRIEPLLLLFAVVMFGLFAWLE
jgi:hypothetical protein